MKGGRSGIVKTEWLGSERKERMENGREGKNWGCSPLDWKRM